MTTLEVHLEQHGQTRLVGQAYFTRQRGRITTTFRYDLSYLANGGMSIEPSLPLVSGSQYQNSLIRAFADSAPDRWGRNIIEKSEYLQAREEGRAARRLDDLDFLLGVSDNTRQGALRYRLPGEESFLGAASQVPQMVSLPQLLHASEELASDSDSTQAIKQLLDTGTTGLGGARPKASLRLTDGSLAIAKFPHASDQWDVMAWEATALDLLELSGIRTPQRLLTHVGDRSVLVLRRFDRSNAGDRLGYISAMTALAASDGEQHDYSEIADAVRDLSYSPREDHQELFDRVVAYVALGNTDDHLRNHGFLLERHSWALSPAFDVNPNPDLGRPRATSIMGADTLSEEAEALLAFSDECDVSLDDARERICAMGSMLSAWREYAQRNGIRNREIAMMSEAIFPRIEAIVNAARSGPIL